MADPSDEPVGGISLHLQRAAGLEVRSDEAADRRNEMRRRSEARYLVDVLVGCHIRNERVGILLTTETVIVGVIIGVGSDAVAVAAVPDGIRFDVVLSRIIAVEPMGAVGVPRPGADQDAIPSFDTRLHMLQALERHVILHTTVGRVYTGIISAVAPDHVVVGDVIVATGHVEAIETPPANAVGRGDRQ